MAIELEESVEIQAPLDAVWRFLLTPRDLARCMPGAEVTEVVDGEHFEGGLKMRVGAISVKYSGRVVYEQVDVERRHVVLKLQAGDSAGGTVNGSISSCITELSSDSTRVEVRSSVDLTGRLVQVGRGMIDGVARQVIGTFIRNVQNHFASTGSSLDTGGTTDSPLHPGARPPDQEALNVSVFAWRALAKWLRSVFDRVFGGHRSGRQ